jgi:hypothetical protein
MRLVMTLIVRDEEDIVEENLFFHLAQGVDFVIAIDHDSQDATPEILERYARAGHLHLMRETGAVHGEGRWRTSMARLAATEFGADWVINNDADEFWWPTAGTLKEVFEAIPEPYGVVNAPRPDFIARPGDGLFAERMVVRQVVSSGMYKVAHRALPDITVGVGSHWVKRGEVDPSWKRFYSEGLLSLPYWPVRILHFPLRSYAQYERRLRNKSISRFKPTADLAIAYREGRAREVYDGRVIGDAAVEAGIREGRLREDRRLQRFFAACEWPARKPRGDSAEKAKAALRSARGATSPNAGEVAAETAETQLDMMQAFERSMAKGARLHEKDHTRLSWIETSRQWRITHRLWSWLRAPARLVRRRPSRPAGRPSSGAIVSETRHKRA